MTTLVGLLLCSHSSRYLLNGTPNGYTFCGVNECFGADVFIKEAQVGRLDLVSFEVTSNVTHPTERERERERELVTLFMLCRYSPFASAIRSIALCPSLL